MIEMVIPVFDNASSGIMRVSKRVTSRYKLLTNQERGFDRMTNDPDMISRTVRAVDVFYYDVTHYFISCSLLVLVLFYFLFFLQMSIL